MPRLVRIKQTKHASLPIARRDGSLLTFTKGVSDQVLDLNDQIDKNICDRLRGCIGAEIVPARKPRCERETQPAPPEPQAPPIAPAPSESQAPPVAVADEESPSDDDQ